MKRLYCAIDTPDLDAAKSMARKLQGIAGIKMGLEFFNAHGPRGVYKVMNKAEGSPLFLDLKYHDIPNTVAGAVRAACSLHPEYLNVHAAGGYDMMRAARDAAAEGADKYKMDAVPKLLAVTVLTSMDEDALAGVGMKDGVSDSVRRLAELTRKAGLQGVVCSAHEIDVLRQDLGDDFILMVPGIRPAGSDNADQRRVMTPAQALLKGADHIVVGRPITQSEDPQRAAQEILDSLPRDKAA